MKQISKSKRRCTAGFFKTTALVATLATAMFASSAQAAVVISSTINNLRASNGVGPGASDFVVGVPGNYSNTLTDFDLISQGTQLTSVIQNINIDTGSLVFSGSGSAGHSNRISGQTFILVKGISEFVLDFSLTSLYVFSGSVVLDSEHSLGDIFASVGQAELRSNVLSGQSEKVFDFSSFHIPSDPTSVSFTLGPGDYRFRAEAITSGGGSGVPNNGFASFDFQFALTEVADIPPNSVPEPGSLALMGAGVLAAAASRRKRPLPLAHA